MVGRHWHGRQDERHSDDRRRSRLRHSALLGRRLTTSQRSVEKLASGPNQSAQHGLFSVGHLCDEDGRRRYPAPQRPHGAPPRTSAARNLSMWTSAYPSGFQPYRQDHTKHRPVGAGRLRRKVHNLLHELAVDVLQPPELGDRTSHFRHLPILQHRGRRTAKVFSRQGDRASRAPTTSAAAWDKIDRQVGRENQVKYYKGSRWALKAGHPMRLSKQPAAACIASRTGDKTGKDFEPLSDKRTSCRGRQASQGEESKAVEPQGRQAA